MGLSTDMQSIQLMALWFKQVGGDPVQKTVSQVEWVGMKNTFVRSSLERILLALQQQ